MVLTSASPLAETDQFVERYTHRFARLAIAYGHFQGRGRWSDDMKAVAADGANIEAGPGEGGFRRGNWLVGDCQVGSAGRADAWGARERGQRRRA